MPEWFRKEQEALGIKFEDFDADDFDKEEARRAWEREARQLKADEYLKRRGDAISISDVLGREVSITLGASKYTNFLQMRLHVKLSYAPLSCEVLWPNGRAGR